MNREGVTQVVQTGLVPRATSPADGGSGSEPPEDSPGVVAAQSRLRAGDEKASAVGRREECIMSRMFFIAVLAGTLLFAPLALARPNKKRPRAYQPATQWMTFTDHPGETTVSACPKSVRSPSSGKSWSYHTHCSTCSVTAGAVSRANPCSDRTWP